MCSYRRRFLCVLVPIGGRIFEAYLQGSAGYQANRTYVQEMRHLEYDDECISEEVNIALLEDCGRKFYGWLIMNVAGIGRAGLRQLFYVSFVSQYFGLTRSGMDTLGALGFLNKTSYYDNIRKEILSKFKQAGR
jgi:hypothetical protein